MAALRIHRGPSIALVILCIVIGFVLNIAVAWSCALWSERFTPYAWIRTAESGEPAWPDVVPPTWPMVPSTAGMASYVGRTTDYANTVTEASDSAGKVFLNCVRIDSGWPMRSFSSTWYRLGGGTQPDGGLHIIRFRVINSRDVEFRRGLPIKAPAAPAVGPNGVPRLSQPTFLPLNPMLLGTVLNTMLYGTVAYLFFGLLAHSRSRRRRTRGLCAICAYDIRGLARCPECGTGRPR
jgi:hypothetical protein